ncbi:MAG: ORF6C domain-containing protein [Lachnospiraceae bacterium]|nr:ORF6C domain-containing protein [Lachnospiraceae bacterium]
MNELKVIEQDLVPVYETNTGEKVVYGSELHAVLKVKSRYREWIDRRLSDIDAIENEDFQAAEISAPSGQVRKDYIIKLDTAKEMAMLERNAKGKEVRKYFIAVEKKYKTSQQMPVPMSISEQIRLLAQGNVELREEVNTIKAEVSSVRSEVTSFKEDIPLFPAECDTISTAVRRKGVEVLGGKGSPAYKDSHIRRKVYLDIYNELYRQFAISSYKALSRNQCKKALEIIGNYDTPLALKEEISECIANPAASHAEATSVIARNIVRMMADRDMKQRDLADRLAVSTGLVSSWCNGTKTPRIDNLMAIADALGVSWDDIVCES